jgi:hypothetical protein
MHLVPCCVYCLTPLCAPLPQDENQKRQESASCHAWRIPVTSNPTLPLNPMECWKSRARGGIGVLGKGDYPITPLPHSLHNQKLNYIRMNRALPQLLSAPVTSPFLPVSVAPSQKLCQLNFFLLTKVFHTLQRSSDVLHKKALTLHEGGSFLACFP